MKRIILVCVFLAMSVGGVFATEHRGAEESLEQRNISGEERQSALVLDDGFTLFDANPVKKYDSSISWNVDAGWYLKAKLRLLGKAPRRSAFLLKVIKNGRQLSTLRCEGVIKPNYMVKENLCGNKEALNTEVGKMNIEVYFVNGDTDQETLMRTYKIDVRKATKAGSSPKQPGISDYYIQRHPDAAVAIAHFSLLNSRRASYYYRDLQRNHPNTPKRLYIHTTYSPASNGRMPSKTYARCTVNGKRINFDNNLNKDSVTVLEEQSRREMGVYTDRKAAKFRRGSPYKDAVEFVGLTFQMPIFTGEDKISLDLVKVEDNPGSWECKIMSNGELYRTFRWEVQGGKIVKHPEQTSGNLNLFYRAAMIDMEIPSGGSPIDFRLMPMPAQGFFYGIPWTTPKGRSMAARVPKKGRPFHVSSLKAGQ